MAAQHSDKQAKASQARSPKAAKANLKTPEPNLVWQSLALRPTTIQPKLTINPPGDRYEQEADRVAGQVMRMSDPAAPITVSGPPPISRLQRKCAGCEEEKTPQQKTEPEQKEEEETLQAREVAGTTPAVTSGVQAQLSQQQSGGGPLPEAVRTFFEPRFGRDLSGVRVHAGIESARMNEELQAQAFTHGREVYFGKGKAPAKDELTAHELTHVIQQTGGRAETVQRQPATTATTATPTTADYREMVTSAIEFLTSSAEFYSLLSRFDQARIDSIVQSLYSTLTAQEGLIRDHLNNDATLLASLRTAYTNAIRALLARAATQLNTSIFSQYLRHIERIPVWAWPNAAALGANTDAQKRAFLATVATAFGEAGIFSNLGTINQAKLEDVLTKLNVTVTELETMINSQLGDDATLRQSLHNSFRQAIGQLLSRASTTIGQSDFNLYMRYRYGSNRLIPDWVDQSVANISTPIPVGASADPLTGDVSMSINGMRVLIQTDTTRTETGAETSININAGRLNWQGRDGAITFTPPLAIPEVNIRTAYGPGVSATSNSGYGRGTTAADQTAGNTSLGFHEGSHGRSFLEYLQNNAFPTFTGTGTMTVQQFRAAITTWETAMRDYNRALTRGSELTVDCVGTTIETYYQGLHQVSPVNCTP
ncbi:MAG: DUF4157 domain-containing protein [Blastocatellia bacterium]|nr:DUF4157 domain-containing protein [Blastocatellia bacterium]